MAHGLKDLAQGRDPFASKVGIEPAPGVQGLEVGEQHLADAPRSVRRIIHGVIVNDDDLAIGGQVYVQFDAVGSHLGRQAKCGQRILWRVRAGTTMGQVERAPAIECVQGSFHLAPAVTT